MASRDQSPRSFAGQAELEPSSSSVSLSLSEPVQADSSNSSSSNRGTASNDTVQSAASASSKNLPSAAPPPPNEHAASTTSSSTTSAIPRNLSASRSLAAASPSSANTPLSSRDSSPARPPHRQQGMSGTVPLKGRRSGRGSQDVSPSRPPTLPGSGATVPSAASIQRALSASSTPQLQPTLVQESSGRQARSQKPGPVTTGDGNGQNHSTQHHWPISPRFKSPPPSTTSRSRRNSLRSQAPRRGDVNGNGNNNGPSGPSIVVQGSTPSSSPRVTPKPDNVNSDSDESGPLTMKGPGRGPSVSTLETVQEGSAPATPGDDTPIASSLAEMIQLDNSRIHRDDRSDTTVSKVSEDLSQSKTSKSGDSGSDSGGNRSETRNTSQSSTKTASASRPSGPQSRSSYTTLPLPKPKAAPETASKNMTVETETVPSIPQAAMAAVAVERAGPGRSDTGGNLRMKASTETIRPKKERRRAPRKAQPTGTASSKADIFEAKVASAVDQADSSDSDETFVYESNPPDPQPLRSRHHSRTPSATSMASNHDHRTHLRSIGGALESNRSIPAKRSMKFANNNLYTNGSQAEVDVTERLEGSIRSGHSRSGHHIRNSTRLGPNHSSHFDSDSGFSHTAKIRGISSRNSSQPSSPKFATHNPRFGNGLKKHSELAYDIDGEGVADDERTPLVGSLRTPRTRTPRRPNSSLRQLEHYQRRHGGSWLRRFAGCIVMTIMIILLVSGAVGFLFATTKPLYGVSVLEIQNVLASEQELMLDLVVTAINPNVISVTISDMDVNVFAKSKHVGTDKWWREHGGSTGSEWALRERDRRRQQRRGTARSDTFKTAGSVDTGTDPIKDPDPENDAQTMLLGRILQFDSALVYDGSPLKHESHRSIGEVRLPHPGNATETGGTERWERVMMYPFELIIRGILKYQLPLSSDTYSCPIGARIIVHPEKGIDKKGRMYVEPIQSDDDDAHYISLGQGNEKRRVFVDPMSVERCTRSPR